MPEIRTDDGPRKLKYAWLGPRGSRLPFTWTMPQWAVTGVTVLTTVIVLTNLFRLLSVVLFGDFNPITVYGSGIAWGGAIGLYASVRIMRHVSFDEPVKYVAAVARHELTPRKAEQATHWVMSFPTITEPPEDSP